MTLVILKMFILFVCLFVHTVLFVVVTVIVILFVLFCFFLRITTSEAISVQKHCLGPVCLQFPCPATKT